MPVLVSSTETDEVFRNDEHKVRVHERELLFFLCPSHSNVSSMTVQNPELLPGFSARSDGEEWSVALRPHLAA